MKKIVIILFMLGTFLTAFSQISDQGLVGHYTFDNNVEDLSQYHNNGVIIGNVTAVENRYGAGCSAYKFDGNNSYILIGHHKIYNSIVDSFTISTWAMKTDNSPSVSSSWFTICSKSDQNYEDSDSPQFRMQITDNTVSLSTDIIFQYKSFFILNKWYLLTYTFNKGLFRFYINGIKVIEETTTQTISANHYDLTIGRDKPGSNESFCGVLDDLRIYNRAISDMEVATLYNDDSEKYIISNCIQKPSPKTIVIVDTVYKTKIIVKTDTVKNKVIINDTLRSTVKYNPLDFPKKIENKPIDYQKEVFVSSKNISITLFDDKSIDKDIVSLNFNGEWIKTNHLLKALNETDSSDIVEIQLQDGINFFISNAISMGTSPPCTLTVLISDGTSIPQKVKIYSTLEKVGAIKITLKNLVNNH